MPKLESNQNRGNAAERLALRNSLHPAADGQVDALRERVLAQWQLRQAAQGTATVTPSGTLLLHSMRVRWTALGLAMTLAVVGLVTWQTGTWSDPTLDELSQPDVLSVLSLDML